LRNCGEAGLVGDALHPTRLGKARGKDDRTPNPGGNAFMDDRFDRFAWGRDQCAIDRLRCGTDARVANQLADLRIARVNRIDPAIVGAEIAEDRGAERAGARRGTDNPRCSPGETAAPTPDAGATAGSMYSMGAFSMVLVNETAASARDKRYSIP